MIKTMMTAVFGTRFDRERKRIQPIVDQIHRHEEKLKDLGEAELKAQTSRFRERLAERTGAIRTELEEVREAKHGCADPAERDQLEGRFQELEGRYKKELAAGLGEIQHGGSMFRRGPVLAGFKRLLPSLNETERLQLQLLCGDLSHDQMAVMNRIERPTK